MSLEVSVEPTDEPITVDQLQEWTRVTDEGEGGGLERLITAARQHVESQIGRSLLPQTLIDRRDCFPAWRIELRRPPVTAVTSIQYVDLNGVTQTFASSNYSVDLASKPARIQPNETVTWPDTDAVLNAVTITYTAGYADIDSVPMPIKQAIAMLCDHWNEHRSPVSELRLQETPLSVDALLAPYKVY